MPKIRHAVNCSFLNVGTGMVTGFKLTYFWDICFDLPNCYNWDLPSCMHSVVSTGMSRAVQDNHCCVVPGWCPMIKSSFAKVLLAGFQGMLLGLSGIFPGDFKNIYFHVGLRIFLIYPWTVLRCRAQVTWFLYRSLYWGDYRNNERPRNCSPAALDSCGTGRWDMQRRVEKLLLLTQGEAGVLPHTNIPIPHVSCQLLSLVTVAGGAFSGGQEELHSGGGSNVKIAFCVYFNFTECWINRVKAPGLQQLPVYLGSTDSEQ